MKDFRIDGVLQRVFVLKETDDRLVYIPLNYLHRVDYQRLVDMEKQNPNEMLKTMQKTKLSNGRNALVQYDNLVQVMIKDPEDNGSGLKLSKHPKFYETPSRQDIQEIEKKQKKLKDNSKSSSSKSKSSKDSKSGATGGEDSSGKNEGTSNPEE